MAAICLEKRDLRCRLFTWILTLITETDPSLKRYYPGSQAQRYLLQFLLYYLSRKSIECRLQCAIKIYRTSMQLCCQQFLGPVLLHTMMCFTRVRNPKSFVGLEEIMDSSASFETVMGLHSKILLGGSIRKAKHE